MEIQQDYRELLKLLNGNEVEYDEIVILLTNYYWGGDQLFRTNNRS